MIFMMCKQGFIVPGKLFLNYFFAFSQDFCFQALILKICNTSSYVVTDGGGRVQNIDQSVLNYFYLVTYINQETHKHTRQHSGLSPHARLTHLAHHTLVLQTHRPTAPTGVFPIH
jgi:hypothetical protein